MEVRHGSRFPLAATYTIDGQPGLVIYQAQGDGLEGLWSIKGRDGSGTGT